jgi:hypothetical protein
MVQFACRRGRFWFSLTQRQRGPKLGDLPLMLSTSEYPHLICLTCTMGLGSCLVGSSTLAARAEASALIHP